MKVQFTNKLLADPPPIPAGEAKVSLFDAKQPGFVAEVRKTGITFYAKYKTRTGQTRMVKVGRFGHDVTLDQARRRVVEVRGLVAAGEDPAADKASARQALTVREFAKEHFMPHQTARKRSWKEDQKLLDKRVLPALGGKLLSQVTTGDVARLHDGVVAAGMKPATANRHLALMKTLFNRAVQWGHLDRSPALGVRLMRENNQRQAFLGPEQRRELVLALREDPDQVAASLLMLAMLTGARFGETASAKWEDIDLDARRWRIPTPKSGRTAYKPLSEWAAGLIESLPREAGNPYLFPGKKPGARRTQVRGVWRRVCKRVGLVGFRVHDLRHNYASILVSSGVSLFTVQALLNHSTPTMTQRYAHLASEHLVDATERAARLIGA